MDRLLYMIRSMLIFALFLVQPAMAVSDLACKAFDQNNTQQGEGFWRCPSLNADNLKAKLSDIDIETGRYTCEYTYADTYRIATSCTYLSKGYNDALSAKLQAVKDDIVGAVEGNTYPAILIRDYDIVNLATGTYDKAPESLSTAYKAELSKIDILKGEVRNNIKKLGEFYNKTAKGMAQNYLYKLRDRSIEENNTAAEALEKSYKALVQPYATGASGAEDKKTFSRFITGMVTLDPDVVEGYYENNGTLMIDSEWKALPSNNNPAQVIFDLFKKKILKENNNTNTVKPDNIVGGWIDIFEQKIWGFYYNVQRRLDIGYDVIATQLLFIMMAFFAMSASVRGGARYITNRENGQSSGEVKVNEASIMKTLGILATVFTFYISVPSDLVSTISTEEKADIEYEMHTNSSLAKVMIRYAMNEGSYFGTMMADLGTDAFLNFVVKKQGLNNGLKERNNVIASLMDMVYYYPALELAYDCRWQNGMGAERLGAANGVSHINPDYLQQSGKTYGFLKENNITEIGNRVCAKMIARTRNTLYNVSADIERLLQMIDKDYFIRQYATSALVNNHIALQQELGWMNIVAVPYTYFMMKNQELFFEPSYDFNKTEAVSRKYVNNLGLRSGKQSLNDTLWMKDPQGTKEALQTAKDDAESNQKEFTRLAVYNFLPGFTSIRNEVLQRIQSLYSDILRMRTNKTQNDNQEDYQEEFRKFLYDLLMDARKYYTDTTDLYTDTYLKDMIDETEDKPIKLHKAFIKISYLVAMSIWKSGFIIVFLSAIAMIIGLKVVLYIINIMVHFFISPFIVVWAFATATDGGMGKIKNYLRDTLIYMLYPVMIVIGVFMFIFAYELFYSIYGFITSVLIAGQEDAVGNAIAAAANANGNPGYTAKKAEMSFLAIYALRDITEILIDLLSVYVAFMTINKFPELVLKMMGVSDSAVMMLPQASEALQSKGGGSVSPLSK